MNHRSGMVAVGVMMQSIRGGRRHDDRLNDGCTAPESLSLFPSPDQRLVLSTSRQTVQWSLSLSLY